MRFVFVFCFFKQKTAYEMRISDWSSDVCSSDLECPRSCAHVSQAFRRPQPDETCRLPPRAFARAGILCLPVNIVLQTEGELKRSEEHTSELQSLMRISYAVFCLKKKKQSIKRHNTTQYTNKQQ